jgi:hypothetical protein
MIIFVLPCTCRTCQLYYQPCTQKDTIFFQPCSLPKPTKCKSITSLGASSHLYNYMKNVIWALQSKHTNSQGIDLPSIPTCHVLYLFQTFLGSATIQFALSILSFNPKSYSSSNCMMRSKTSSNHWSFFSKKFTQSVQHPIRWKIWYMGNIRWENSTAKSRGGSLVLLCSTLRNHESLKWNYCPIYLKLQHFLS